MTKGLKLSVNYLFGSRKFRSIRPTPLVLPVFHPEELCLVNRQCNHKLCHYESKKYVGTLYMSNAVINNRDKKLSETKVIFAIKGVRY